MEEILAMEHITKTYPGVKALDDVSISFIQGEVHAVMGENGAGKSTLMKILNGMIPADNPRFAITVIMKDPQGTYGGMTAGPVFAKIGEFLMQKDNVPTSSPRHDAIAVDW